MPNEVARVHAIVARISDCPKQIPQFPGVRVRSLTRKPKRLTLIITQPIAHFPGQQLSHVLQHSGGLVERLRVPIRERPGVPEHLQNRGLLLSVHLT